MDKLEEEFALAIAGHFGPAFDDLPSDRIERRRLRRYGDDPGHDQEDVRQAAHACAVIARKQVEEERSEAPSLGGDDLVVRMLYELHSHVPEEQRPMSMSDLSDEQAARARKAVHAVLTEWEAACAVIARKQAEELEADKARLDFLQSESDDLCCFSIPTGGDDADIGWRVVGHYQADPQQRVIGQVWHDDLRAAIDEARTALDVHGTYSPVFCAHPEARAALQRKGVEPE